MPFLISKDARAEALADSAELELIGRNCHLNGNYKKLNGIKSFAIDGDFIAYASPDSTFAVTKKLLNEATKTILIGIYDFSAEYMKQIILNAMQRKVKVTLMLDIDSKDEQMLFEDLKKFGCDAVEAPSCASKFIHYFPSSHEKVIVIDGLWCMVQSGNYSNNSIPLNEKDGGDPKNFVKGNRDMGVAIKSKPLADFFTKLLTSDIKLELKAEGVEAVVGSDLQSTPDLVEAVPEKIPTKLFPSKTFSITSKIDVTPVLTPDNYMDVIVPFLESAKKSILIENQYIRSLQPETGKILAAIKRAMDKNKNLDVRIVLGKLFGQKDFDNEIINVANMKKNFGLVLDKNIRYIDTTRFVHCHNKTIIIDNKEVLVSSQNWSDSGVTKNREAGLLMKFPQIAAYYASIFESDWSTAQKKIPHPGKSTASPEDIRKGNFVKVVAADYQDV